MRGMRSRIAILLTLLVIGGLLSGIQPVQASGPWALDLTFDCQAKAHFRQGENGLSYPSVQGITPKTATYSVLCGKPHSGVHNKHTFQNVQGQNIPNMCIAEEVDALGKKPDPKLPRPGLLQNTPGLAKTRYVANCLILALVTVHGFCDQSNGEVGGAVHTKDVNDVWKSVYFTGSWSGAVEGALLISGSAGKFLTLLRLSTGGPLAVFGYGSKQPDLEKSDSCIAGDGKLQNLRLSGTVMFFTTFK